MPTATRSTVTRKLSGLAIPDAFAEATICAEARLLAVTPKRRTAKQRRDLARIRRQAAKLEAVS